MAINLSKGQKINLQKTSSVSSLGVEDIIEKMDEFNSSQIMCELVLFENVNDETFSVQN